MSTLWTPCRAAGARCRLPLIVGAQSHYTRLAPLIAQHSSAAAAALLTAPTLRAAPRRALHSARRTSNSAAHAAAALQPAPVAAPASVPSAASSLPAYHFDRQITTAEAYESYLHTLRTHPSLLLPGSIASLPPSRRTAVVAVSGGVDSGWCLRLASSCGAFGRVVAVHMRNWDEVEESGHCSGERDARDAAAICSALGVELHQLDFSREYFLDVFQSLLSDYARGRTPSPDVLCNRLIKFSLCLQHVRDAFGEGAVLVTGHYARIRHAEARCESELEQLAVVSSLHQHASSSAPFEPQLYTGLDPRKDQSYFLSSVPSAALAHCWFPLGNFHKSFVKQLAAKESLGINGSAAKTPMEALRAAAAASLASARSSSLSAAAAAAAQTVPSSPFARLSQKRESMGICFIGKRSMREFLGEYIPLHSGPFLDVDTGAVVGEHQGWEALTVGQKASIGGCVHKYYVCAKTTEAVRGNRVSGCDPLPSPSHAVYVCATRSHPALYSDRLIMHAIRWVATRPLELERLSVEGRVKLKAKIRSSPGFADAWLEREPLQAGSDGQADGNNGQQQHFVVRFAEPQFAVAAGQTCVLYAEDGARCLGEGVIEQAGPSFAQMGKPLTLRTPAAAQTSEQ